MLERQPTLLVVDDEPDVVKSVQDLLRYDYRVLGATRAAQGREILDREDVDVVMSDQRMPETTGVEFLRAVREDHPDAVRLLFTGYADLRAVIAAINQGNVYRYIQKPWDPDELQTVVRDAVELHDLMAERKQLLAELQRRNEDLQAANAELERASALQVGFIEVVSHELRTPLTILLGLSRLAAGMPDLPAPLRDWLERIHQASQRLQRLVEQIVAMLMAGKFQQTLQCERVTLDRLLADAADDVRPFIELRRQTLRLEGVAPDLGSLPLDASKIRDCLNHLLLNAIKFTPDGGGSRWPPGGKTAMSRFASATTGSGLDRRSSHCSSNRSSPAGTPSTTRRDSSNTSERAGPRAERGQGVRRDARRDDRGPQPPDGAGPGHHVYGDAARRRAARYALVKILIADDDPIPRRLLQATLARWEYEVVVARDGAEAWQLLQNGDDDAPKLAILDWLMPAWTA
jgi:response regulator RpfG family c-di-GMP phosphodiesterase